MDYFFHWATFWAIYFDRLIWSPCTQCGRANIGLEHRNLRNGRRMLKGAFFQLVYNLFCFVKSPVKMFLFSKLP
jgi:hypothetical protein